MPASRSHVHVAPHTVSRDIGGAVIGLDTRTGRYFRLTGPAATIWTLVPDRPEVTALVDEVAARYGRRTSDIADDVEAFLRGALEDGLLEGGEPHPSEAGAGATALIRMEHTRLRILGSLDRARSTFDASHHIHFVDLLEPSLLRLVEQLVAAGTFYDRTHEGIGTELCLQPGVATSVLQLLFNDPALRAVAAAIGGLDDLGCYDGRVYRLSPAEGHYDSWHSDAGEDRRLAVSLNLSPDGYEGGELEIRRTSVQDAEWTVASTGFGSAVMFRISPELRHRVIAVRGTRPRTAWAGWFRTVPVFEDLFLPTLHVG